MSDARVALRRSLRRWIAPLLATPLHPQWLIARKQQERNAWVAGHARGDVLDVGCGESGIRHSLDVRTNYLGVDYPTTAIHLYGSKPQVFADAGALPFADSSFDTVMLLDVLEHVAEPEKALAEACRVTRSDGQLLLTIPFAYPLHDQPFDYQRFTRHGHAYRLLAAGYSAHECIEASGAVESACMTLSLSVGQGMVEAVSAWNWRLLLLVPGGLLVVASNVTGWLMSWFMPVRDFYPMGYYIRATRAEHQR